MLTSLLLLFFNNYMLKLKKRSDANPLNALIFAVVMWTLFGLALTEVLSAFHILNIYTLWGAWGTFALLQILFLLLLQRNKKIDVKLIFAKHKLINFRHKLAGIRLLFILFALSVIFLALFTVPYNWDSMTYHLSRIAEWAQYQSVHHYATNILRQIASPVLSDYINLQVYIMAGYSDQYVNLLQCISYLINAMLVYGIAVRLTCDRSTCRIAVLLYLSTPIAFSEALTTQADNFAAMWLLIFVYCILIFVDSEHHLDFTAENVVTTGIAGLCVAFGYLSKPSVGFGMVVFAVWLLIKTIQKREKPLAVFKLIGGAIPCIVLPVLPELLRNWNSFHALSAPGVGARQLVGTMHPSYLMINFLKNLVHNLPNIYWGGGRTDFNVYSWPAGPSTACRP